MDGKKIFGIIALIIAVAALAAGVAVIVSRYTNIIKKDDSYISCECEAE